MRIYHKENPFHRIEQWNGSFYRPAEVWEVGAYVLVSHHVGTPLCNTLIAQERFLEIVEQKKDDAEQNALNRRQTSAPSHGDPSSSNSGDQTAKEFDSDIDMGGAVGAEGTDEGDDEEFIRYLQELRDEGVDADDVGEDGEDPENAEIEDDFEEEESDEPIRNRYLPVEVDAEYHDRAGISSAQRAIGTYVRVIHTNGIHNIAMISCECRGHDMLPHDLIASRLLPSSFERIRTLFTTQLLDHFRLCNLELKASAYQFYHLIQRLTNPMNPAEADNLYREFRRMSRIWRWMKRLKWAGFGNKDTKASDVRPGQLTIFCPACPQPGVNIPENWKEDPARHVLVSSSLYIFLFIGQVGIQARICCRRKL